jgi:hypothetical protein
VRQLVKRQVERGKWGQWQWPGGLEPELDLADPTDGARSIEEQLPTAETNHQARICCPAMAILILDVACFQESRMLGYCYNLFMRLVATAQDLADPAWTLGPIMVALGPRLKQDLVGPGNKTRRIRHPALDVLAA